jgi:hypothetical protein
VLGCTGNQLVFAAPPRTVFSDRITCILLAIVLALVIYALVALAAVIADNKVRPAANKLR